MRKILIASHGKFAEGVVDTVTFFAGEQNISFICAYIDNQSLQEKIEVALQDIKEEDELVIFTDLLGGSVNRAFLPYLQRQHTHIITGVNLAVILEIVAKQDDYLMNEEVNAIVNEAQKQLVYLNCYEVMTSEDDE
ncbi:PTS sugar transporter subunit IIA [Anaerorhabdus furcosa]|uniref:PTS system, mannose-specific IIA component n=1 Tax=Anaerorhabdus furcosa TaxID=118967 RepID=A0A1T4K932_9FIRM|nr:PTS sugar transporter subunit IIA [Anaerorhabdus furcosa]SJZ38950.1 PTS system, mannose-specific IIA component [Anaerorhabdus furcosa]